MATQDYKIVVFGDSIAWGQGLAQEEKYYNLVANSILQRLNVHVGPPKVFAHSGATINYNLLTEQDRKYLARCGERVLNGEMPTSFPTITKQVADFPQEEANTVDLVLLSGGINDVNVFDTILGGSEEEIRNKTLTSCYYGMRDLLTVIDSKFTNERTKILVTGYFRLVTEETNLVAIGSLGFYAGVGALATLLLGAGAALSLGLVALATVSYLKDKWIKNWRTFDQASSTNLSKAVREIDNGRGKFLFVYPGIRDYQALSTHDSHFYAPILKAGGEFKASITVEDSIKSERISQCDALKSTEGEFCQVQDHCPVAAIGHPNAKGARRYAMSILAALFPPPPIPAHCIPIADSLEDLTSEVNMLQEQLQFATSTTEKSFLARAINRINSQIAQKQNEL